MTLIRSLVEMAAAQTCGNCHQPMSGNHFYRKIGGKNQRFCKKDAIQKGIAAGYQPSGNASFPLGSAPPSGGPAAPAAKPAGGPGIPRNAPQPTQKPQQPPPASTNITRPQLESWLKDLDVNPDQYEVVNGRLNIKTSVSLVDQEYTQLPVPFGKIDGDFEVVMPTLKTLKNFPNQVEGSLIIMHTEIEDLNELEVDVRDGVYMTSNKKLQNFRKVHKHIKSVGAGITVDIAFGTSGGLGFLLIPGIESIQVPIDSKVAKIMQKHFDEDADLLDIQEELIDAGFKNIARI